MGLVLWFCSLSGRLTLLTTGFMLNERKLVKYFAYRLLKIFLYFYY